MVFSAFINPHDKNRLMNNAFVDFFLLVFVALFTLINPLGVVPVYAAMTSDIPVPQARRVALTGTLVGLSILLLFALTQRFLFDFFGVSVESLRMVGGFILLSIGWNMLQARPSPTKMDDDDEPGSIARREDIAVTPLGIPILAGPGAITTVILYMNQADDLVERTAVVAAIVAVLFVTFLALLGAKRIMTLLGDQGSKVLVRMMGLILMVIGVEFFFSGFGPVLRGILEIG
jgi:multiple antibiotic resistance protein